MKQRSYHDGEVFLGDIKQLLLEAVMNILQKLRVIVHFVGAHLHVHKKIQQIVTKPPPRKDRILGTHLKRLHSQKVAILQQQAQILG
jgi:hypothetical protein